MAEYDLLKAVKKLIDEKLEEKEEGKDLQEDLKKHFRDMYRSIDQLLAEDPHIEEIVRGNENLKKRMEKDVVQMCKLLKLIHEEIQARENEDLQEGLKKHFIDIYWSLKLHMVFHLGTTLGSGDLDSADSKLEEVGRLFGLTDEEIKLQPDQIHAIDPGSKVLEIVSKTFYYY